jgi:hypothetical protein
MWVTTTKASSADKVASTLGVRNNSMAASASAGTSVKARVRRLLEGLTPTGSAAA